MKTRPFKIFRVTSYDGAVTVQVVALTPVGARGLSGLGMRATVREVGLYQERRAS